MPWLLILIRTYVFSFFTEFNDKIKIIANVQINVGRFSPNSLIFSIQPLLSFVTDPATMIRISL